MSKLYKDLLYDTDRVMQPGDPVTSQDGTTEVKANNDGTASIKFTSGRASVTFASGWSITDGTWSYTAPSGGETIEFFGPIESSVMPGYTFWVPEAYKDLSNFDPSAQTTWCLTQQYTSYPTDKPNILMLGVGPYYWIENWDSATQTILPGSTTGMPTAPTMTRAITPVVKTVATIDDVQAPTRYSIATPTQTITTTTNTDDTLALTLYDRAINQVSIPSTVTDATISFPTKTAGYARNFFVRLTITGSTVPAITWQEVNGDPIDFDVDDESWAEIEQGVNILMFTETNQASAS